jgi:hypothetical protein
MGTGASALKVRLTIDRFEGERKQIAVLLADDGTAINFPRRLLPKGVKGGDILSLSIERDEAVTEKVVRETRAVQDELKKTPPRAQAAWQARSVRRSATRPRACSTAHGSLWSRRRRGNGPCR